MGWFLGSARSNCPIAGSLDIFGDTWTLLVLRDLLLRGVNRFQDLASSEQIASNILSNRLERLQDAGLIERYPDIHDGRKYIYVPTEAAIELIPLLIEMMLWGDRYTSGVADPSLVKAAKKDRASFIKGASDMARKAAKTALGT